MCIRDRRDPLVEYKEEAYRAFGELVNTMYEDFLRTVLRMELAVRPDLAAQAPASPLAGAHFSGPAPVDGDVGPDNYGWGAGYDGNASLVHNGTQGDWAAWLADMNG